MADSGWSHSRFAGSERTWLAHQNLKTTASYQESNEKFLGSRRNFLKIASMAAGATFLSPGYSFGEIDAPMQQKQSSEVAADSAPANYTLRIKTAPVEIAKNRILSLTTYNGQFPGPLLRLKEGQQVTVDVYNETDVPEQLHWHGQMIPVEVDGAAEEGTPFIPAHGKRRIVFTPKPAGFRFYHTHNRAGADLYAGQYNGEVGPVYIEPKPGCFTITAIGTPANSNGFFYLGYADQTVRSIRK
jgi:FtsP/CotA-like multicopper oxidase with cupredoxin domain